MVDEGFHRDREAEFEQAGQHRAAEVEQEQPAVGTVVGEEATEHARAVPAREGRIKTFGRPGR
jgi:hypothetical protein